MKNLLVFTLVLAGLAVAQTSQQSVRDELVKTDQIIADVKPVVEASNVPEAKQLLEFAVGLQRTAWQAFNGRGYRKANDLTLRARERARQAKLVAGVDPERVRAEVRRTADAMVEYGPAIVKANNQRANELWKMAQTEQSAADNWLAQLRYGYALKFTMAAREHGRSAFGLIRGRLGAERVAAALDRTDALIDKAADPIRSGMNGTAIGLLNKAVEWQKQARQAFAESRLLKALKLTLSARDLLLRAWESVRADASPALVDQAIAENDALISDWADDIRASGNARAQSLLEQALPHQDKARQLRLENRFKTALAEAGVCRRLLKRTIEGVQLDENAPGTQD